MGNKSKQHFVFPEFLSKRPEFALSEKLKKHAKITYYQSIDDIHKICANTVELIIIEDKVYDQWSSHSPKDPPSGIILIDTGKVETIPDSPHKVMAWVSLDNMSNQCWNFTLEQCLENVKLYNDREKLESRLIRQDQNFVELHDIGVSLSSEKDLNALLNLIVSKAMNLTYADGGTLFLIESAPDSTEQQDDYWANKRLRLQVSKNHSRKIDLKPTHLLELSSDTIVGNVILNGKSILIEDYQQQTQQKEFKWGGNEFDKKFNYHTKSLLTVPIRDTEKQVIGAIQLVNSKKHPDTILSDAESFLAEVIPFEKRDVKFVESIASQAAIAIGNAKLLDSVQILFDGFINASVKAIESRDPTTSGHSSRVATLTIALAETVDQLKSGRFADTSFSADQLSEIRYASLLHDFGKIGVRERVLVKSKKLYPEEQQALMDRFRLIRAMMELKSSKEQISYFLDETHENALWKYDVNSDLLQAKLEELDDYLKLILSANEPSVMAQEGFEKLQEIAQLTFQPPIGGPVCYLSEDELNSLSVKKGSLNEKDRQEIESHVTHTFNFLKIIPWSENLNRVPEIAHAHHEKLNGSGYPQQLTESEIPLESKMMTIADIYDALTAWDRPYKKAMPSERALNILNFEAKDKHIDPVLLEIFISAKLYSLVQRPG
jgi:HD-GYP domain-containing protein (c-di-GMP phosphodiesterase class II)